MGIAFCGGSKKNTTGLSVFLRFLRPLQQAAHASKRDFTVWDFIADQNFLSRCSMSSDGVNHNLFLAIAEVDRGTPLEQVLLDFPECGSSTDVHRLFHAEISYRHRQGRQVDINAYKARFPAYESEVIEAFESFQNASTFEQTGDDPPMLFGEYKVLRRLAEGGFGTA